jgi:UDPglucose 6-dehydrogenase/GDP-mannose 6-dehydrogenase
VSKVAIIGTGYVGLVTGACLADLGHQVVCVDHDRARIDMLQAGRVPFHEPGLQSLVDRHSQGLLSFKTELKDSLAEAEFIFIAVGTPGATNGSMDLRQVEEAFRALAEVLAVAEHDHILVVKSTVVPGTTDRVLIPLLESAGVTRSRMTVVVNPEFLTEGTAIADFQQPDRIVVGSASTNAARAVAELYKPDAHVPIIVGSAATAEMIKYASNTLLATLISFSNEISDLGEAIGDVDAVEVMRGVHSSRYLTSQGAKAPIVSFLEAGCGFGGSCLPKDTAALVAAGRAAGSPAPLLEAVLSINQRRAATLVDQIARRLEGFNGRSVAVLGLAFKPDTDDVRESPAFPIIQRLLDGGAQVLAHDPLVRPEQLPAELSGRIDFEPNLELLAARVEALVLVTRWDVYRSVPEIINRVNPDALVFDGRRLLDPQSVRHYFGVGRGF